jgi:heme A synthase
VATLIATYCLIVLGSTVRVTNSGMGCPGWPLCSGQYGPIDKFSPLMEQSHRYLASVVTILIVFVTLVVWRAGTPTRHLRWPVSYAVGAIFVQVALGAVTVLTTNAPWTVALHLLVAMLFLAIVTVVTVGSFVGSELTWLHPRRLSRYAWGAVGGLYLVMVSGSLVVDGGAQSACRSWLVCAGSPAPGGLIALQLIHRSMVLIGGTLIVVYLVRRLRAREQRHAVRTLSVLGLFLLVLQVAVGIFNSALAAPAGVADVHVATASALWIVIVALAGVPTNAELTVLSSDRLN